MKLIFSFYPLLLAPAVMLSFGTCSPKPVTSVQPPASGYFFHYDLENPSLTINLVNESLQEISGISPTDKKNIYLAIADERGEVFFIDVERGGVIVNQVLFKDKGDFEGVEMADGKLWAVKSDGKIFEISQWSDKASVQATEYPTHLKKDNDVEGLGYDPGRKALLLACKGNPDSAYLRHVYAFDLIQKQLSAQPVYSIDPNEVNRLVPYSESEKHDYFSPSGIAVHPVSKDVYVVSSALKRLVILDGKTGSIVYAQRIDKKMLPQPEGIAFDSDGNLHLSSEGKKGEGLMLQFNYRKQ